MNWVVIDESEKIHFYGTEVEAKELAVKLDAEALPENNKYIKRELEQYLVDNELMYRCESCETLTKELHHNVMCKSCCHYFDDCGGSDDKYYGTCGLF